MNTKRELRSIYGAKRIGLPQAEYERLCKLLLHQFGQVDLTTVRCIHMYFPIAQRKEPDTLLISEWLQEACPWIEIVYPKVNFTDLSMQSFVRDRDLAMGINVFGIPEPITGNETDVNEIDLILVPLLAFDKRGYRVGYGKGFYDRFMARCKPKTVFIGLSFFEPVEVIEDLNEFDIPLTSCITPDRIWRF